MLNTATKLLVYLAVWKRPEITEICFMGLNRLRKIPGFDINVLAVISEESMIPLCEQYDVNWVMHENQPLGRKKNFGLKEASKYEFDFLMELGSDDVVKNDLLSLYDFSRDVSALADFAIINTENGDCRKQVCRDAYYGAGRLVSRKALEAIGFRLWHDDLQCGLDNYSTIRLAKAGFGEKRYKSSDPLLIDFKSKDSMSPFNYLRGVPYEADKALQGLSSEEVEAINALIHAEVEN